MTPRERLAAILNGKATKEILETLNAAVSGAWVGHENTAGEKLYITPRGAFTKSEIDDFNADRSGNWQLIDIDEENAERAFYTPVEGAGRPLASFHETQRAVIRDFFG